MNARQQRFVEEYLVDANARQAAIRAGYSARSAEVNGPRLLRNAQVATAVEEKQKERAERTQVTADRVIEELALIAFGDIGDFFDATGNLRDVSELSEDAKRRLGSIDVLRETTRSNGDVRTIEQTLKVKPWDKLRALDMLGKNLGMFRDKVNIGADVSLLDALRRIEAREDEEAIRGAK